MARKTTEEKRARARLGSRVAAARWLIAIALGLSAFLAYSSWQGGPIAGCSPGSGCDQVLHSQWSRWLNVPVSAPAALVDLTLLIFTFGLRRADAKKWIWPSVVGFSVLLAGAAAWFTALQFFELRAYCRFCLAAHASGFVAACLLLGVYRQRQIAAQGARTKSIRPSPAVAAGLLAGLAGVGALMAGQIYFPAREYELKKGGALIEAATARRVLSLHQGRFQLLADELPVIGSPRAPHLIVSLFDYTCHYCRALHPVLEQAQRQFSNQLAIVSLPIPLDPRCNRLMKQVLFPHRHACEYARLGLAVWRAQPAAQAKFDSWIFAPSRPPSVAEAAAYAKKLVGAETLAKAMADPWIENQIKMDVDIYEANSRQMRSSQIPQVILGNHILLGPVPLDEFDRLLETNLNLRLPPRAPKI